MEIEILGVDDPRIHECYKIRYEIYCKKKKWLNEDSYFDEEETDCFDSQSVHLLMKSKDIILGYCRLILPGQLKLPISEYVKHEYIENKCFEISRLIILDRMLKKEEHAAFYQFISDYARAHDYKYALASVDKFLLRLLRSYGMDIEELDVPSYYFGGELYPILINTFDKLEVLK